MDITNQCTIQKGFCLHPEIVSGLAFAFGISDQRRDQLQNVLFAMDIGERIIVHGLFEVNGVQHLNPVRFINDLAVLVLHGLSVFSQLGCAPLEHFSALD